MLAALRRIHHVFAEHGAGGLGRFARKASWERLPLHPVRMPIGPGHLQIEVSGKCNLKCPMCPRTFSAAGWENMSFATYRRIVESVPGLFSVNLQGFGEPFLNPELAEIVRWTRERGIEVGFATNATLLGERRVRAMLDAGLHWLNLSMDGATAETYERIRVGARFDQVVGNVRALVRLNRAAGDPIRLALVFVCMRSNVAEVECFLDLAQALEIGTVFFAPVLGLTAEVPAERLGPCERARLLAAQQNGRGRGLEVQIGVFGDRFQPGELPCDWPWNKLYVTASGQVTPCCIETETFLGDAARDGVLPVWNGKEYRALRAGLVGGDPHAICRRHCFVADATATTEGPG